MTRQSIYAILDTKAQSHLQPWFVQNDDVAIRAFSDAVNDREHNIGKHPEDYHLVRIGSWDQATGSITAEPAPVVITTGQALRKPSTD